VSLAPCHQIDTSRPVTPSGQEAFRRRLLCAVSAIAGIALITVIFYPGMTSIDAIIQLRQARSLAFDDHHPPLMGRVWAVLDQVIPGPSGMLLLQNLMFWVGLGIVACQTRLRPLYCALFIWAVGLFPPISSALGTIWKDVGMAAALLLAFSLFLYADRHASWPALLAGLLSLFYGFSVRHNAAPAALPLALWAGFLTCKFCLPRLIPSLLPSALLGMLILVLFALTARMVNQHLIKATPMYPVQQIIMHDLTAISVKTGLIYTPVEFALNDAPVTLDKLACVYSPDSSQYVFSGKWTAGSSQCAFRFKKVGDERTLALISDAWIKAVTAHPHEYIEHRWDVFSGQLGINHARVCYPLHVGVEPNSMGIEFHRSALYDRALAVSTEAAYRTPLFRAWIYFCTVGVLLLVTLVLRRRDRLASLALGSSGLLYGLAYLGVGIDCAFRMNWWTIVAAMVLPMVMLSRQGPGPGESALLR
jgi:hypothetical protein